MAANLGFVAGNMADFFCGVSDDTTFSARATANIGGVTLDTVVNVPATAGSSTIGADGAYDGGYRLALSGTQSSNGTVTATLGTSEVGSGWTTRLTVTGGGGATEDPPAYFGGGYYG